MFSYAAVVSYKGVNYSGFQKQPHAKSIQQCLTYALGKVANQEVHIVCAGRTDSGVHALYQVVSFSISTNRTSHQICRGANSFLPKDIRITWVKEMPVDFNARYSAYTRDYVYVIDNQAIHNPILLGICGHVSNHLNVELMNEAASKLVGTHDFQSFRGSHCQAKSSHRTVEFVRVWREKTFVYFQIIANAFLHHMVRNIIGSLIDIGTEKMQINWIQEVLQAKNRCAAGMTFSPAGLYLRHVSFSADLGFPKPLNTSLFSSNTSI